jgi:hypothetical protein
VLTISCASLRAFNAFIQWITGVLVMTAMLKQARILGGFAKDALYLRISKTSRDLSHSSCDI